MESKHEVEERFCRRYWQDGGNGPKSSPVTKRCIKQYNQKSFAGNKCNEHPDGCSTLGCETKRSATNPGAMGANPQCLGALSTLLEAGVLVRGVFEKDTMASKGTHTVVHNTSHLGDSYARPQVRESSGAIWSTCCRMEKRGERTRPLQRNRDAEQILAFFP